MENLKLMQERHSVRSYLPKPIEGETLMLLIHKIHEINMESGLNIQLILNEEKAFSSKLVHYGMFHNVKNYVAMVGTKSKLLEEKVGYYGEKLVLYAQSIGLNTCWVALTYRKIKNKYLIKKNEKLVLLITIGYGENEGFPHKKKTIDQINKSKGNLPSWYIDGLEAVLLSPSAMNQQKYSFELIEENIVKAQAGIGFYTHVDLGIAKYHFELGAKRKITWL